VKYLGGRFISPVFTISVLFFCFVCGIAQLSGGGGMCLNSSWQIVWLICYPIGFIGIVIGLGMSAYRTYKHLTHGPDAFAKTDGIKDGDTSQGNERL
jgi:hypothetical protein